MQYATNRISLPKKYEKCLINILGLYTVSRHSPSKREVGVLCSEVRKLVVLFLPSIAC